MPELIYNKTFSNQFVIEKGEYEKCTFVGINLSNCNLSGFIFVDCIFKDCNLCSTLIKGTAFRTIHFIGCKMLGLQFESSNEFGFSVNFTNCLLGHTSFFGRKMKKTIFISCQLNDVDFSEVDLTESKFENCNLVNATFNQTVLIKADFRTASNYVIDPELNKIKKAKFTVPEILGLLAKYDIIIEK